MGDISPTDTSIAGNPRLWRSDIYWFEWRVNLPVFFGLSPVEPAKRVSGDTGTVKEGRRQSRIAFLLVPWP